MDKDELLRLADRVEVLRACPSDSDEDEVSTLRYTVEELQLVVGILIRDVAQERGCDHVCGAFQDTFDWSPLGEEYLNAIGARAALASENRNAE
jgi:hypothetical protein